MVHINIAAAEISIKIVYFSVSAGAANESLKCIKNRMPHDNAGDLVSLSTQSGQTMFFDFLPVSLGQVNDYNINLKLYAAPEAQYYDATRKLVADGADAVIFVADSRTDKVEKNYKLLTDLWPLVTDPVKPIPMTFQWNYLSPELEDQPLLSAENMAANLNQEGRFPAFSAASDHDVLVVLKETVKNIISTL